MPPELWRSPINLKASLSLGAASSNTIGGTTAASPNIISGNIGSGISISGTGTKLNKVQHNLIGTNACRHRCFA